MPVLIARVESTSLQRDSTRGDDQGPVVNPRNFSCRQWRGRLFSWAALFFLCRLSMLWTAPPAARADTRSGNSLTCGRCRPAPLQKPLSPAHLRGFFWRGRSANLREIAPLNRITPKSPPVDLYSQTLCPLPDGFAAHQAKAIFKGQIRSDLLPDIFIETQNAFVR